MNLTDQQLYELCQKYGTQARLWRQKFIGLLPEVYKRKLYEKKGFSSIFEFAAKLAGVSKEQVKRALRLDRQFEDKPILKSLLHSGEVSINKLARISSIATPENQEILAEQIKLLPKKALETLVKDEKTMHSTEQQTIEQLNSVPRHSKEAETLNLSEEVKQKLLELQNKGIDINSLLLEFLEKRELEIAQEKEKLSATTLPTDSRYIPAAVKKILKKEFGEKCSISGCSRSATEIHHTQRFSLSKNHNPKYLAPMCEEHHTIAHSIDMNFHLKRRAALMQGP